MLNLFRVRSVSIRGWCSLSLDSYLLKWKIRLSDDFPSFETDRIRCICILIFNAISGFVRVVFFYQFELLFGA